MDANVWNTTRIAGNRSALGPVQLRFRLSSKLKYFRSAVNLPRDIVSQLPENRKFHCKENEVGDFCRTVLWITGEQ